MLCRNCTTVVLLVRNWQVSDEEKSFKRASTNRSLNKNTRPSLRPRSICNVPHSCLSPPERCSITPLSLIFLAYSPGQLPSITQMCHSSTPSARLLLPATNFSAKQTLKDTEVKIDIAATGRAHLALGQSSQLILNACRYGTAVTHDWLRRVPNPTILLNLV